MNEEVKKFLAGFANETIINIPDYGFTINDAMAELSKGGEEIVDRGWVYRRLEKRVNKGELIKVKLNPQTVYYVPRELSHLVELDKNILKDSE